jgi:hypothetical protein
VGAFFKHNARKLLILAENDLASWRVGGFDRAIFIITRCGPHSWYGGSTSHNSMIVMPMLQISAIKIIAKLKTVFKTQFYEFIP